MKDHKYKTDRSDIVAGLMLCSMCLLHMESRTPLATIYYTDTSVRLKKRQQVIPTCLCECVDQQN